MICLIWLSRFCVSDCLSLKRFLLSTPSMFLNEILRCLPFEVADDNLYRPKPQAPTLSTSSMPTQIAWNHSMHKLHLIDIDLVHVSQESVQLISRSSSNLSFGLDCFGIFFFDLFSRGLVVDFRLDFTTVFTKVILLSRTLLYCM